MSKSVNNVVQDAVEAYRGDESAATRLNTSACRLEGLCEDVSKILRVPEKASLNTVEQMPEVAKRTGEDALVREAAPLNDHEQHKKSDEIEILTTTKNTDEIKETSGREKVIVLD